MKKAIFGGYDKQEIDSIMEGLQERTNVATVKAAELQTELEECRRQAREKAAQAAEELRRRDQEITLLKEQIAQINLKNGALEEEIQKLQRSVGEYEHKISKVGQIYITAYDEAEKITEAAKSYTNEAVDRVSETVAQANHAMKKQLGFLLMAKESMKETMASASNVLQKSFDLFTEKSMEIDRVLLDVESYAQNAKEKVEHTFDGLSPQPQEGETQEGSVRDLVEVFKKEIPEPGTL